MTPMPDYYMDCTPECFAAPECTVCHMAKRPRGRSSPVALENGMCGFDCPGYFDDPYPGHEWPSEMPERLRRLRR